MIRSQNKALVRLQDEHIARELGISVDTLGLHPFDLIDAGLGHPAPHWRLLWRISPPEPAAFYGTGDSTWSEVPAMPTDVGDRKTIDG